MSNPISVTYVEWDADAAPSSLRKPISALAFVEWRDEFGTEFHAPAVVTRDEDGEIVGEDTGARESIPDEVRLELARMVLPAGYTARKDADPVAPAPVHTPALTDHAEADFRARWADRHAEV